MKKIFLMLVAALMVGTATVNAQIWGGQLILRGGFAANNFKGGQYERNRHVAGV